MGTLSNQNCNITFSLLQNKVREIYFYVQLSNKCSKNAVVLGPGKEPCCNAQ